MSPSDRRYLEPSWFTRRVFNGVVQMLTKLGVSVWGSRVLRVRGRKSGEWRSVPVNVLTFDGERYLVAPRGETEWVRNLRHSSTGELLLGKRSETFHADELGDDEKVAVLRAYLRRWRFEVGAFFNGVGPKSTDDELRAIAPNHPVFRLR